jgi:type I restriction enzyme S subunit
MENKLPEGWEWKKLGEIGEICSGGTPSTRDETNFDGNIPWVTPADLSNFEGIYIEKGKRNISEKGLSSSSAKLLPKNSVIFSSRAPIGYVAIASNPLTTNQGFKNIILKEEILPEYIYYYLKKSKRLVESYASGTTFLEVSATRFSQIPVVIPPLETQQKIVSLLEKAEETKKLRAQADELTQKLLQSVFLEMFGDIVENPNRWNMKKIGDVVEIKTGGTPSRNIEGYWQNGSLPWVKTTEIKENIIYETEECITESGFQNSNATLLPQNSILIAMYGQGKTRGRTAKLGIQATTNQACAAILPSDKYESNFLWTFLRLSYDTLRNLGRGGNQPNLNLSMIKDFKVYFPPIEKQKIFSEIFDSMDKTKQFQEQSSLEINNLFDALMQKAFTGELIS